MASRSLNRVQLIGNLTRDPELRYTPQGTAVCSFGLATNRSWAGTDGGDRKEETEFHRLVAWNKLAEICSQFLTKGRKCYVEGRLQTRRWQGQDGAERQTTEIVISEMIVLDSRPGAGGGKYPETQVDSSPEAEEPVPTEEVPEEGEEKKAPPKQAKSSPTSGGKKPAKKDEPAADVNPDDIPF